jgi:hypothetical protein
MQMFFSFSSLFLAKCQAEAKSHREVCGQLLKMLSLILPGRQGGKKKA